MEPGDDKSRPARAPGRRPSWPTVLTAPWIGIVRPRWAGRILASSSRWSFWACYGIGALALVTIAIVLNIWDASITAQIIADERGAAVVIADSAFTETWHRWHAVGWFGPAEKIGVWITASLAVVMAIGAWLYLPIVHRGGSARASYARSFRAMTAGLGLFNVLVLLVYAGVQLMLWSAWRGGGGPPIWNMFGVAAIFAATGLFLFWLSRAADGAGGESLEPVPPPRCEGCGYDLTHVPDSRVCSECGLDVASSLTPEVRRPGAPWQNHRDGRTWMTTSAAVLASPTRFYGGLRLRFFDDMSRRFAAWHYATIGAGAGIWIFISMLIEGVPPAPLCGVPIVATFLFPLVAWGIHRLIGALAASWCIAGGLLPDAQWMRKLIDYEAAFLWTLCLYNGVLITSFITWGGWMTDLVGGLMLAGRIWMPPEPAALLFGSGALCAAWLWRFRRAMAAVRWSNF